MPGQTFVVVADPALLPAVLGRPGLPKSRVYELGFFVCIAPLQDTCSVDDESAPFHLAMHAATL